MINRKRPEGEYVTRWDQFVFLPRAVAALRRLRAAGVRTIIATNQRGVARGLMSRADLDRIHDLMRRRLAAAGADVDAVYCCPDADGPLRKPEPGMLRQAAADDPRIDLAASVMIGDSIVDMEAGRRAGCHTVLVATPGRARQIVETARAGNLTIDAIARSLHDAVDLILSSGAFRVQA